MKTFIKWLTLSALRTGIGDPALAVLNDKIHVAAAVKEFGSFGFTLKIIGTYLGQMT